jgi:hypothetical protein
MVAPEVRPNKSWLRWSSFVTNERLIYQFLEIAKKYPVFLWRQDLVHKIIRVCGRRDEKIGQKRKHATRLSKAVEKAAIPPVNQFIVSGV